MLQVNGLLFHKAVEIWFRRIFWKYKSRFLLEIFKTDNVTNFSELAWRSAQNSSNKNVTSSKIVSNNLWVFIPLVCL